MAAAPPDDLIKAIREGRALIVCGAGVSRLATDNAAPGWEGLIREALNQVQARGTDAPLVQSCEALLKSDKTERWLAAADLIQTEMGGSAHGRYRAFLEATVGNLKTTQPAVFQELARIGAAGNRIVTTNYDNLLCADLKWQSVTWQDPLTAAEVLNGKRPDMVLHLHGHWFTQASVVFSKRDYDRVKAAASSQFLQQLATVNFTLVFVGCGNQGLADDNVGALLDWFAEHWAGLGKQHYVLVREGEEKSGWPDAVTAIAYGKDFEELPAFLAKLAPPAPKLLPPDPKMIGRQDRLEEVVQLILQGDRPIIVPGGPGIGKTTLALAAAHDARVKDRFGAARTFVDLQAVTSAEAMLRAVAGELAVETTGSGANILAALETQTAKAPTLAILDNLETPWSADAVKTEEMLGHLAGISGLRLVLTVRGETPRVPGGGETLDDVERLKPDDAKKLFLRESRKRFETDPALPGLLAALEGHPLSIVLMAAQTGGRPDLAGLVEAWDRRRAAVLARGDAKDRLTSVRVSLGLSLDRLGADAKRLLGLVALLPAGLQEEDVAALLPNAIAADAVAALVKARLVEGRGGRLTMLAPLRETAREEKLATPEDEARLNEHFLAIAADGDKIGTGDWPEASQRVTREAGNLDAVCLLAVTQVEAGNTANLQSLNTALRGHAELNRFGLPAEIRSLHRARALPDSTPILQLKATCIEGLGNIALARSDHATARTHYEEAKPLYERVGALVGQANCIKSLGNIALERSDLDTARTRFEEAKPLYERVGDLAGQASCIKSLGDIALRRSDHNTARTRYEEAKPLFERAGSLLGQANCISGLGDIALARADHDTARASYEEAKPLFERVGSLLGQAVCIARLGEIALARSDHDTARARFEEAKPLFERVGDLLGQANCINGLGNIALERSDHDTARARFVEAKPLYERFGALLGQANCIASLGDIAHKCSDHDTARARYEKALALYAKIPDPYSIGLAHLSLMRVAANAGDRARHREDARKSWASIGRQDLIAKFLDGSKDSPSKEK